MLSPDRLSGDLDILPSGLEEQFTFFSNYGVSSVELVAPGQSIISTYLGNTEYASLTGTSFGTSMAPGFFEECNCRNFGTTKSNQHINMFFQCFLSCSSQIINQNIVK